MMELTMTLLRKIIPIHSIGAFLGISTTTWEILFVELEPLLRKEQLGVEPPELIEKLKL